MRRTRPFLSLALLAGLCVTAGGCSDASTFQPFTMAQFRHTSSMNASDSVGASMSRGSPVANVNEREDAAGGR